MTDREVMQQALEALETKGAHHPRVYAAINALRTALEQAEQEPTQWRDMVVVTLVREGINKHKARELADHFAAQPEPPPEWEAINNIIAEYGLQAISFVAEWKAAQRPWVGLTDEDWDHIDSTKNTSQDTFIQGAVWAANQLKERNT